MPRTSRTLLKASILYLCLGAWLGALLLINRWLPLDPRIAALKASHIQLVVVGWLTQFILGVSWWLFPPLPVGLHLQPVRRGQHQRGSEPLFWATFASLNIGILLAAIFEPLFSWTQSALWGFLSGISGIFFAVAAIAFVINMWRRVRKPGRR